MPWEERRAKLATHVPEFASSTKADQNNILGLIYKKAAMLKTPAGKYQQITDLTSHMVNTGELSAAEQFQVHKALAQKGYGPGVPIATPPEGLGGPPAPDTRPSVKTSNPQLQRLAAAMPPPAPVGDLSTNQPFTKILDGAASMAQPGADNKMGGASQVIRGAGSVVGHTLPLWRWPIQWELLWASAARYWGRQARGR